MSNSLNLEILDRFRHVERMMRTAAVPCDDPPQDSASGTDSADAKKAGEEKNCPSAGVLKRDAVLPFLLCRKEGMKQKEIADEIRVSPSTLSEMINRLVEDGYVERRTGAGDRRVKMLFLTEKGVGRAEYMLSQITLVVDSLFVNLDDAEKQELIRLLDKLVGNTPYGTEEETGYEKD
jgi:DNA-binding MarR family transcriptional regulator